MKKLIISLILILVLSTPGCSFTALPMRREIDDLLLVEVLGLDKSNDGAGNHIITIASRILEQSEGGQTQQDGSGEEGKVSPGGKALITTTQGKTLFDAVRNIQNNTDTSLFWAHTKYLLIGEEAARDNIAKYIDLASRDHEFQLNCRVYVVKGTTAKELMMKFNQSEFYIADKLESLGRSYKLLGTSEELELVELMRFFDIHFGSARIPCIQLVNRESSQGQKAPDIESDGYAIAADLNLVSYIGRDISRGVNLIANKIDSSIVTVKDLTGEDVTLELIFSNTEAIPHFAGDVLEEITLKTTVVSNLGEIQSQVPSIYEENIEYMEAQQSSILENEIKRVLGVVREAESDCLSICDMIRLKNPVKWHKIEDQWINIMQYLKTHVVVESHIKKSYELDEPSGLKGKK